MNAIMSENNRYKIYIFFWRGAVALLYACPLPMNSMPSGIACSESVKLMVFL